MQELPKSAKFADRAYPEYETQKHHLIPENILLSFKSLSHNAKLAGYRINTPENGICLPYYVIDIVQHDLQCHRGNHPSKGVGSYGWEVRSALEKVEQKAENYCRDDKTTNSVSNQLINKLNELSKMFDVQINSWQLLLRKRAHEERMESKNSFEFKKKNRESRT